MAATQHLDSVRTIGIVSDTHGHLVNARKAVEMLAALEVEAVLHCGDIGSPEIVGLFGRWPSYFVLGNVDDGVQPFEEAVVGPNQVILGRFGQLIVAGRKVAMAHGDDAKALRQAVTSGEYDLVCTGHTHVAKQHHQGSTLVLNPGALCRANPYTLAIVDLQKLEATHVRVD